MAAREAMTFRILPESKAQLKRISAISAMSMTQLVASLTHQYEQYLLAGMTEEEKAKFFAGKMTLDEAKVVRARAAAARTSAKAMVMRARADAARAAATPAAAAETHNTRATALLGTAQLGPAFSYVPTANGSAFDDDDDLPRLPDLDHLDLED
jgi:hypothetical protein